MGGVRSPEVGPRVHLQGAALQERYGIPHGSQERGDAGRVGEAAHRQVQRTPLHVHELGLGRSPRVRREADRWPRLSRPRDFYRSHPTFGSHSWERAILGEARIQGRAWWISWEPIVGCRASELGGIAGTGHSAHTRASASRSGAAPSGRSWDSGPARGWGWSRSGGSPPPRRARTAGTGRRSRRAWMRTRGCRSGEGCRPYARGRPRRRSRWRRRRHCRARWTDLRSRDRCPSRHISTPRARPPPPRLRSRPLALASMPGTGRTAGIVGAITPKIIAVQRLASAGERSPLGTRGGGRHCADARGTD